MLLYGDEYVPPLSAALGIAERTVQRWANGTRRVPPDAWGKLSRLLAAENERIGSAATEVREIRQRLREEGRV